MLAAFICSISWGLRGDELAKILETYLTIKSKKAILRLDLDLCTCNVIEILIYLIDSELDLVSILLFNL